MCELHYLTTLGDKRKILSFIKIISVLSLNRSYNRNNIKYSFGQDYTRFCCFCDLSQRTVKNGNVKKPAFGSMPLIDMHFKRVAVGIVGLIAQPHSTCVQKVDRIQSIAVKGTHTVYFSSSFYIINQKPMIHRTDFHCITTWVARFSRRNFAMHSHILWFPVYDPDALIFKINFNFIARSDCAL